MMYCALNSEFNASSDSQATPSLSLCVDTPACTNCHAVYAAYYGSFCILSRPVTMSVAECLHRSLLSQICSKPAPSMSSWHPKICVTFEWAKVASQGDAATLSNAAASATHLNPLDAIIGPLL